MSQIKIVDEKEKNKYQKLVDHLTQSWEWGDFRATTGIKVVRLGEYQDSKMINAWQVFFHPIPHTKYTAGYFPRPKVLNKQILTFLKEIGRKENCLFIKIEPEIEQTDISNQSSVSSHQSSNTGKDGNSDINQQPLAINHLVASRPVLPQNTFILDLTQPEEEILRKMHEKTRYNIRLAQKQDVVIEEKQDEQSLESFLKFLEETETRQGFHSHPSSYFRKQWQLLQPKGMIHLLIARFNKTPLSGIFLLHFKDRFYYAYGGSSDNHREKMPNQLLHFEAIKLGKKLGCKTYDLWGAYWQRPDPSDPWYGIYRFKSGFGGRLVSYVGAYDLVLNPALYKIFKFVDFARWPILHLKRQLLRK